jgi:hypothetical protein
MITDILWCENFPKSSNMTICQVHNMDIVPDLLIQKT